MEGLLGVEPASVRKAVEAGTPVEKRCDVVVDAAEVVEPKVLERSG